MSYSGPNRKYPRAEFIDYSDGNFFVTICTKDKLHYFGSIRDNEMHLTEIGSFAKENIGMTTVHYPDVRILNSVIMPNHVHLIVAIDKNKGPQQQASLNLGVMNKVARLSVAPGRAPTVTTHHNSRLAVVVGSFKAAVSRFANKNKIEFDWQPRFHEHFIRNHHDGDKIWNYIDNNILNWNSDCFYQ